MYSVINHTLVIYSFSSTIPKGIKCLSTDFCTIIIHAVGLFSKGDKDIGYENQSVSKRYAGSSGLA